MATSDRKSRGSLIMFDEAYDADTKVYAADNPGDGTADTFHADPDCHQLAASSVAILSLPEVLQKGHAPLFPCLHCTLDIMHSIQVAIDYDGLNRNAVHPLMDPSHDARPRREDYE